MSDQKLFIREYMGALARTLISNGMILSPAAREDAMILRTPDGYSLSVKVNPLNENSLNVSMSLLFNKTGEIIEKEEGLGLSYTEFGQNIGKYAARVLKNTGFPYNR